MGNAGAAADVEAALVECAVKVSEIQASVSKVRTHLAKVLQVTGL